MICAGIFLMGIHLKMARFSSDPTGKNPTEMVVYI